MNGSPAGTRGWPEALRLGLLLFAAELLLTRLSSGERVAPAATAASALGWALLPTLPAALLDLLPLPTRWRARGHALVAWGAMGLLGLGLVGPALHERGGTALALGGAVAAVALSGLSARFRPSPSPYPRPEVVVLGLTLSVAMAWAVGPGEPPPLATAAALALAGVALVPLGVTPGRSLLAASLAAAVAAAPGRVAGVRWVDRPPADGPDLVLLTVDTLRADAAGSMVAARRLADGGTRFTQAQAPAPWTLPSVATLLTGRPPSDHGAVAREGGRYSELDPAVPTVAEALAAAGWDTVAVAAPNPFVGPSFGLDRGFDHFHQPGWSRHALPRGLQNLAACPVLARATEKLARVVVCHPVDGAGLTAHALEVLAQRRERPLFLWVHYLDTHLPYAHVSNPAVSPELRRVLAGDFHRGVAARRGQPGLVEELAAAYADEVAFVDGELVRLLDALGPAPARGRVVVLTSDHGEERFEHGGFEHGHTLYQELLHVPLVVAGLGTPPTVDTPVGLADVAATLLARAGLPADPTGAADLAAPPPPERHLPAGNLLRLPPDELRGVRQGSWKLIEGRAGRVELYDLGADAAEARDLAAVEPGRVAELRAQLESGASGAGPAVGVDVGLRAQLEELGYTEGEAPRSP